ncbi:hypothetical protein [Aliikangiella sp. IMCC44359]|uniref:hypothetical protein n=1 Tax=Aliikangiella sp. IMCC44359 TaxID=3459125 RepID=UPI00403AE91C
MNKSVDLNALKERAKEFQKRWRVKLNHLSGAISRSGMEGAAYWFKSHHQLEELKSAIEDLLIASERDSFRLSQVETTLSSFVLPEEDQGQAEWYKTADNLLESFTVKLQEKQQFDKQLLNSALKELKFISEADEFHSLYQIESIQQKVTQVYQELQKALAEFKTIEQQKLKNAKEQEQLKLAQLETDKAQAEAKKAMLESVKIKEKRIAIMEEKKRKIAEKELLESEAKIEFQKSELNAKQAEEERQSKLQDAYVDLQLEEKITNWTITDTLNILKEKLEKEDSDPNLQLKITQIIEDIVATD